MNKYLLLGCGALPRLVAFWVMGQMLGAMFSRAADTPDSQQAYAVAAKAFQDELWDRAEREFAAFVKIYPDSKHVQDAILLQAQSRFQLKRYGEVIDLLLANLNLAGAESDRYRYWIAEARLQQGRFAAAADTYAELLKQSPNSVTPLRLKAAYGEAFARFKLDDFRRTIELLQNPRGAFQDAARRLPREEAAFRGNLLLAEALYRQKDYAAAASVLNQLANRAPTPEFDWERQYLFGMVELADHKMEGALARTTNLLALATAAGKPLLQSASLKLQAEILENRQPDLAIQVYDRITQITNLPNEQVRQAVLKSVDLAVAQNRLGDGIGRLQKYLASTNSAADPALDLIRLTLGEVYLKHYYQATGHQANATRTAPLADTNSLEQARLQFDLLVRTYTNSPLLGKAFLNRGWCLWEEARAPGGEKRLPESLAAFRVAAERLTNSEDQVVARFKWADCQFLQKDFTNALQNYRSLLANYETAPEVRKKWFDQALYQIIRASIEIKDLSGARAGLDRLLTEFPASPLADHSVILFGQALLAAQNPTGARGVFADFPRRFPNSALKPEAELGLAESYTQEGDWPGAIQQYTSWLGRYTNHTAWAQTEFDLGLATYKAGNETNALSLFSDVVRRFPTSRLAPLAQLWIADYFYSQGPFLSGAFQRAEAEYKDKILIENTNAPIPELAYQAKLMAAHAAFSWQGYNNARSHLTNLITALNVDTNASPALLSEAYFLWGKIDLNEPGSGDANAFTKYDTAISKFLKVKGGALEPRARCQIGYCYMQLAATNTLFYAQATNALAQVVNSPLADVTTRSEAEYLLASVLEKQALDPARSDEERRNLQRRALDHYVNIIYGKGLRSAQQEQPDLYWVNRAGLSAGTLAERLQLPEQARRIYERLQETLPSMRDTWTKKLEALPAATSARN